jgi:type IV pilus biogenesis protein CpaD/CtpE
MKALLIILALTLSGCKTTQVLSVPTVTIQKSGAVPIVEPELKEVMEEVPAKKGGEGFMPSYFLF